MYFSISIKFRDFFSKAIKFKKLKKFFKTISNFQNILKYFLLFVRFYKTKINCSFLVQLEVENLGKNNIEEIYTKCFCFY